VLTAELVLGFLLGVGLTLGSLYSRRRFLARSGGSLELSWRLKRGQPDRGWVLGVGRYDGDELQWFRVFSLSNRPRRALSRRDVVVEGRRRPTAGETRSLLRGAEVLQLTTAKGPVEIAMEASAITGFLAWLEARPPGATLPDAG
jgi:hypothetical protein